MTDFNLIGKWVCIIIIFVYDLSFGKNKWYLIYFYFLGRHLSTKVVIIISSFNSQNLALQLFDAESNIFIQN